MTRSHHTILLLLIISVIAAGQEIPPASDTAEAHHQRGVEYHLRRCLDDASREYTRALELDPPRELTAGEWGLVRRFAPRLYTTPSEFFPLKDFAVVLHPTEIPAAFPSAAPASQPLAELPEPLTRREREVLQMLAAGLANKEIAARLNISDHTAKFHVAAILGKLGAATRTEAVALGIRRGLVLL